MVRVVIADDFEVVRTGLKGILARQQDWTVCGEAADGAEAVSRVLELKPDVIILDINMPVLSGVEAAAQIRKLAPATKILILSMHEASVISSFFSGVAVDAYLSKSQSNQKLIETLTAILEDPTHTRHSAAQA